MYVKICGLTSLEDAVAAAEAGADLLGFNFYPRSPRYVSPDACAAIVAGLRQRGLAAQAVGVFVNAPVEEVTAIAVACRLDLIQLHGDELPAVLHALGPQAFKAVRPKDFDDSRAVLAAYGRREPPALLLDASVAGQYGGTGQAADWDLAAAIAAQAPILLAGGLHPGNVAAAVAAVRPWGVDVASGVEAAPGRKDRAKVAEFIAAALGD